MKILRVLTACVLLTALFLTGCGTTEVTESTLETTEATEAATTPTEAETIPTEEIVPLATVSGEDLVGVWIAAADPVISENPDYTQVAKAGYYEFSGSNFSYTQILMAEQGVWCQIDQIAVYAGTYELSGDALTLHYTQENGQTVDYTEVVSMVVDRSCADMCVRTPDHPKLGQLRFFRKARAGDPVNSITVLLNSNI